MVSTYGKRFCDVLKSDSRKLDGVCFVSKHCFCDIWEASPQEKQSPAVPVRSPIPIPRCGAFTRFLASVNSSKVVAVAPGPIIVPAILLQ